MPGGDLRWTRCRRGPIGVPISGVPRQTPRPGASSWPRPGCRHPLRLCAAHPRRRPARYPIARGGYSLPQRRKSGPCSSCIFAGAAAAPAAVPGLGTGEADGAAKEPSPKIILCLGNWDSTGLFTARDSVSIMRDFSPAPAKSAVVSPSFRGASFSEILSATAAPLSSCKAAGLKSYTDPAALVRARCGSGSPMSSSKSIR